MTQYTMTEDEFQALQEKLDRLDQWEKFGLKIVGFLGDVGLSYFQIHGRSDDNLTKLTREAVGLMTESPHADEGWKAVAREFLPRYDEHFAGRDLDN